MSERFFDTPDLEKDKKAVGDEEKHRGGSYDAVFYKPKPGVENVIRILQAPAGSGAHWNIKVTKHFVKHDDGTTESFVCMKEVYGKPCPACEKFLSLDKKDPKRAVYSYRRTGVFNIIDRNEYVLWQSQGKSDDLFPKVKLYEAPIQAVWYSIVQLVGSKGRQSHIFDDYNENGKVVNPGRDWIIYFNPNMDPQSMYRLVPSDPCPLGEPEEIKKWLPQIIPLITEKIPFYAPISYEDAQIKTFGTTEERQLLKLSKQAVAAEQSRSKETGGGYPSQWDDTERQPTSEPEQEQKAPEKVKPEPEPAKVEPKEEPKKEAPRTEAPKKEETKPEVINKASEQQPVKQDLSEIQAKIAAVRAKYGQGKK